MNFKTDTKEKFTVVTPQMGMLSANMTAGLKDFLLPFLQKDIPHIVLNMQMITGIEQAAISALAKLQQSFYENNASFVICQMQPDVIAIFEKEDLLDLMNTTPTESEAWDIVQMEEIERELMNDFDDEPTA